MIDDSDDKSYVKNNVSNLTTMGQCPWISVTHIRQNRYPFVRKNVNCKSSNNNISCSNISKSNRTNKEIYSCEKLTVLQPIIYKTECINGVYIWRNAFENVTVACFCMINTIQKLVQ